MAERIVLIKSVLYAILVRLSSASLPKEISRSDKYASHTYGKGVRNWVTSDSSVWKLYLD